MELRRLRRENERLRQEVEIPKKQRHTLQNAGEVIQFVKTNLRKYDTSKVYAVPELKERLTSIFERNGVRQTVLFGLYAKGSATPHRDVDIHVDSGLRGLAFLAFGECGPSLETPVNLLDVRQIDSGSKIDREIRESGVPIYGRLRPPGSA